MKRILKLSIVCILSSLILLSSACTPDTSSGFVDTTPPLPAFTRGVHTYDVTPVESSNEEDYIVRNGEFQYKVITPATPNSAETTAKAEFGILLNRALGQQPIFISDLTTEYDENARYISIGSTEYLKKSGIVFGEEEQLALKGNGTKIISKGRNVFILGGNTDGVIYGVYDYFRICFDFEQYGVTCIQMDTTVKNLPLMQFNVTDIPDIDANTYSSYGPIKKTSATDIDTIALTNENTSSAEAVLDLKNIRKRFNAKVNLNEICIPNYGLGHEGDTSSDAHNVLNVWSTSKEGVEGKWYSDNGGYQLCYTAHGDEESYQRMIDFGVNEMIKDIMRYPVATSPARKYMYLGQEDNGGNCLCKDCSAAAERDGSPAGMEIRAANEIVRKIKAWMNETDEFGNYVNAEYRRPDFKMVIMAYGTSVKAPAHYDKSLGKYVVNEGCEMDEDIIIQIVAQDSPSHPIYHKANERVFEDQKAWLDIAPACWVWNHVFYYNNLPYFADIPTAFSNERFQWWAEANASHLFNELGGGTYSQSWYDMYFYIFTKLSWDSTIPMSELIENFCKAYFGPAGQTMLDLFFEQQSYHHFANEQHMLEIGTYWHQGNQFWTEKDYPYQTIKYQLSFIDKALKDIEILLDSKDPMYVVYKERIDVFSVSIIYMIQDIYGNMAQKPFTTDEWEVYRNRAIEVLETHSMSKGKSLLNADDFK